MSHQFVVDVFEEIFKHGLEMPRYSDLAKFVESELADCQLAECECGPIDQSLIDSVVRKFRLTTFDSDVQCEISRTAGAGDRWLAIHEAGHAIVGIDVGLLLTGVRFFPSYAQGPTGVAVLHNSEETDEGTILRLIAVDMAGNIAQLLSPGCDPPIGGRLSELCDDFSLKIKYPTDFFAANLNADKIMTPIRECTDPIVISSNLKERKPLFEEAERLAEEIIQAHFASLASLADRLMEGPLTGTEVKRILAGQ